MISAVFRLVAITLGTLTLTFFAVFFVRWVAKGQMFSPPTHPWFDWSQWRVIAPDPDLLCAKPWPAQPQTIVWLKVKRTPEGWRVDCPKAPPLSDFFAQTPHQDWLVRIDVAEMSDPKPLVDELGKFDANKRFAVHAPAQKVARALRKAAPQWLFAADSASLLRLHAFGSLWLESAIEFWPDFVIASDSRRDGTGLNEREVQELKRRQKRVIWNALQSSSQPPFAVDGTVGSSL